MVVMHLGSTEIMKETTEAYTIWQEKALLTVINMQKKDAVQQRHQNNYIDEKFTVH